MKYVRMYHNLVKFSTTILVLFYTVFKSRETETQTEIFRVHWKMWWVQNRKELRDDSVPDLFLPHLEIATLEHDSIQDLFLVGATMDITTPRFWGLVQDLFLCSNGYNSTPRFESHSAKATFNTWHHISNIIAAIYRYIYIATYLLTQVGAKLVVGFHYLEKCIIYY